jgi:hypothetical protein
MHGFRNFPIGFVWGLLISIPLWVSLIGWLEFVFHLLKNIFFVL